MESKLQVSPQTFELTVGGGLSGIDDRCPVSITNTTDGGGGAALSSSSSANNAAVVYRILTTDKNNFSVSPREGILQQGEQRTTVITYTGRRAKAEAEEAAVSASKKGATSVTIHHVKEASFKLEYRVLTEDDRDAIAAMANGASSRLASGGSGGETASAFLSATLNGSTTAGGSTSTSSSAIADLLKAAHGKKLKRSVILTCTIVVPPSQDTLPCTPQKAAQGGSGASTEDDDSDKKKANKTKTASTPTPKRLSGVEADGERSSSQGFSSAAVSPSLSQVRGESGSSRNRRRGDSINAAERSRAPPRSQQSAAAQNQTKSHDDGRGGKRRSALLYTAAAVGILVATALATRWYLGQKTTRDTWGTTEFL